VGFLQVARRVQDIYTHVLKAIVYFLAGVAGFGLLSMMGITCIDVILRIFRHPLIGAFDVVKIVGALTISAALPYTTAVKGHVAIEYFYHKLSRRARVVVDVLIRLMIMTLIGLLTRQCIVYGQSLKAVGQVTPTLQLSVFWVPYVMAFSCAVVVLVVLHNLLHPGKEMIKP